MALPKPTATWVDYAILESTSTTGVSYKVARNTETGALRCECKAFRFPKKGQARTCKHIQALDQDDPQVTEFVTLMTDVLNAIASNATSSDSSEWKLGWAWKDMKPVNKAKIARELVSRSGATLKSSAAAVTGTMVGTTGVRHIKFED
jgi:hypothetical protein